MQISPFALLPIIVPIFIAVVAVLVFGSILYRVFRAFSGGGNGGGFAGPATGSRTSLGEDGFWITDPRLASATTVYYQYWIGGVRHDGQVAFQPDASGRQFVYTGSRPERVVIQGGAGGSQRTGHISPMIDPSSSDWDSDTLPSSSHHSSSSGFPSAY